MRPRKYPYKQKPLFPSTKRVVKAIRGLEALKEHYLSLPEELKPRAKTLAGEESDYVTYYDLAKIRHNKLKNIPTFISLNDIMIVYCGFIVMLCLIFKKNNYPEKEAM